MGIQQNFNGSNIDGSFTMDVLNLFSSPLEKNPIAADLGLFRVFFLFILKIVYFVYSLEAILMRTHNIPSC